MDLAVFAHHFVHGMAVPTALTVQTTKGVHRTLPVFPNIVGEQLSMLLADIRPNVIKLGMLASDDVLLRVANTLDGYAEIPRVVDPVLRASDGAFLLERRAWGSLVERLIAGAALVTPNLPEAEALTGERDPERAAAVLLEAGAHAVLVKGGHADGPADDLLATRAGVTWLRGERIDGSPVHGTGCALSAAIAARLARGTELLDAVRGAKTWVARAIANAQPYGQGARILRLDAALD
jgi:hydroxymethylpyrimidine/phosphomethylpyrimidine kinase